MWKAPAGPSCACTVHRASAFLRDYTRFYTLVRVHRASAFLRSRLQISPNNLQSAVRSLPHAVTVLAAERRVERELQREHKTKKYAGSICTAQSPTRTSGASASAQHGELLLRLGCTLAPIHRAHGPAHRSTLAAVARTRPMRHGCALAPELNTLLLSARALPLAQGCHREASSCFASAAAVSSSWLVTVSSSAAFAHFFACALSRSC